MSEKHTVKVQFRKNFKEIDDVQSFVRSCLEGNKASGFAREVHVWEEE